MASASNITFPTPVISSALYTIPDFTLCLTSSISARPGTFQGFDFPQYLKEHPIFLEDRVLLGLKPGIVFKLELVEHIIKALNQRKKCCIRRNAISATQSTICCKTSIHYIFFMPNIIFYVHAINIKRLISEHGHAHLRLRTLSE
jgi:hypothetical protein